MSTATSSTGFFPSEDTRIKLKYWVLLALGIVASLYHMWFAWSYGIQMNLHLVVSLGTMMTVAAAYSFDPKVTRDDGLLAILDNYVVLPLEIIIAGITSAYVYTNYDRLYIESLGIFNNTDVVVGFFLLLLVFDLSRRTFGWVLVSVGLFGFFYALTANYWPGILNAAPLSPERLIAGFTVQFTGLYDLIYRVAATYIVIYIVFAGFLESYGALGYFIKVGTRLGSRMKSGITQTAVIASLGMGSVNGSAAANAATTGALTIPLMKEQGIKSDTAGAIESVASSGGQIMPPIMGAAAFLMAEITGTSYLHVITVGLLPALLFYGTVAVAVYFITDKEGVSGSAKSEDVESEVDDTVIQEEVDTVSIGSSNRINVSELGTDDDKSRLRIFLEGLYLWVPIAVLVYTLVILQFGALYAGILAILAAMGSAFVQKMIFATEYRAAIVEFLGDTAEGMRLGSQNAAGIAMAAAIMGLFVEVLSVTGFTVSLTQQLIGLSGGVLLVLLPLAMLAAILFGLGMPTTGAYIVAVILIAPALTDLGVRVETAHFFVFYFAILSALTPPVAIAAIITSEISGASFFRTCYKAMLIGLPLFILPYIFVMNPEILYWEFPATVISFIVLFTALIALSTAVLNSFFGSLNTPRRLLLSVCALTVMVAPVLPFSAMTVATLRYLPFVVILLVMGQKIFRQRAGSPQLG